MTLSVSRGSKMRLTGVYRLRPLLPQTNQTSPDFQTNPKQPMTTRLPLAMWTLARQPKAATWSAVRIAMGCRKTTPAHGCFWHPLEHATLLVLRKGILRK